MEKADIGDIIQAEDFTYGKYETNRETGERTVVVDGKTKGEAYDPTRGDARFVVEKAQMQGGGTGHGPHDIYPDGWYIEARRLTTDGRYDAHGELIRFYQSGCFTNMVKDVDIVGKMQRIFV